MESRNELSETVFRNFAAAAWDKVPSEWRTRIQNVALLVEDEPSDEVRERERLGPHETLLGLYHGIPETERGESYGIGMTLPDTITLYRLPILEEASYLMKERTFPNFEAAAQEAIRETLWHEIGHYLGLSENDVRVREHKGTNRFPHE